MVKNVKPTAAVASTSWGVFRWSASAPVRPIQPACRIPSSASSMTRRGMRPVRAISRIDCWGKIGSMPAPPRRIASTWPGVARPMRSPKPKLGRSPRVTQAGEPGSFEDGVVIGRVSGRGRDPLESVDLDDGLDHAGLGPGVRREDLGQLVEGRAVGDPGRRVDLALLDEPDDPGEVLRQRVPGA